MVRTCGDRLMSGLSEMGRIGGTPAGGVTRLALTEEDRRARDLFATRARESGLAVRVDDVGNQYARLDGDDPSSAPVLIGSHLDTVPLGGRYDGAFGVIAGLEVARALRESGFRTRRPVEVVNFTNEEGERFRPSSLGSGVLAGHFARDWVYAREDLTGVSFRRALEEIGYLGEEANRPSSVHAYLEVHIEQGPVLEESGLPLAAVEGILGRVTMSVELEGESAHAGACPIRSRRDAGVGAARLVLGLRDLALRFGDPAVVTVGHLEAFPGSISQVPGRIEMSIDLRHSTADGLAEIDRLVREMVGRVAAEEKLAARVETIGRLDPVLFDGTLVEMFESEIRALGLPGRRMMSGAGHDAKFMAGIAPTAMLFVRTPGGRSHCEEESLRPEDAQLAADVLLHSVLLLTGRKGSEGGDGWPRQDRC